MDSIYYWLIVTHDKYELPLVVADSIQELARYDGVSVNTIYSAISHYEHGRYNFTKYRRVERLQDGD